MDRNHCIIWLVCLSVSQCWLLPNTEPVMHGHIQSPQYPQPYPPNLHKQWDLWVPKGFQIQLSLTHLDIKPSTGCSQDSLTVLYDLKVLGQFCGQKNSTDHQGKNPILSPSNTLTLIFQTSDSTSELQHHTGFSTMYKAIDVDECSKTDPGEDSDLLCSQICINTPGSYHCSCYSGYKLHLDRRTCLLSCSGCIFDEHEGYLSSPGYPKPSPPFLSCKYIISVEPRFIVTLNFSDNFHVQCKDNQRGSSCRDHWLQVTIPGRSHVKYCGAESPGVIVTNSSTVRLDYHTEEEGLSNGWSLQYSTHEVKCPQPGSVAKGRVTPDLNEYFSGNYIHVTCDQGYKLMMDGQEVMSFSTMCQSSGQWHLPLPECHIIDCGEPEPLLNGGVNFLSGFQNQYRSVVQYRCNEPFYSLLGDANVNFTCEADRKWRSTHEAIVNPVCMPVCGQPINRISVVERIIGGRDAPDYTIPWQVLLNVDEYRAGGIVIGERWIMTAANNVVRNRQTVSNEVLKIFMGHTDVNTMKHSPMLATSVHVHPDYNNPNSMNYNNDIALIKLQDTITFNSSVLPVCLPAEGATYDTGVMGLVSGFGVANMGNRQFLTNKLKYVPLPVVDQETCRISIALVKRTRSNVPDLTNNMFCAGIPEGGKDSCSGDSGSPFTLTENGRYWAAGIVSWGVECGGRGTYGVYTRVANYLDWIKKTMQEK